MMGMGLAEMAILLLLFGAQDNFSLPLGVPPGAPVALMSDVADNCLVYASWATRGVADPGKNPTERWFAQAKIQTALKKIRDGLMNVGLDELDADSDAELRLMELATTLAGHSLDRATAIFAENAESFAAVSGGCVIHLAPEAVESIADNISRLKDSLNEKWQSREFQIEDNHYLAFTPPGGNLELAIGLRGQFAIIGYGPDSIAKIEQRVRTPEPSWLSDMKKRLAVERICSVSHFEIAKILAISQSEPWYRDEGMDGIFVDLLALQTVRSVDSICGLDANGFVSRHLLAVEGAEMQGLLALFDVAPLEKGDWSVLATPRDLTFGMRISIPKALELIDGALKFQGESIDEGYTAFEQQFGLNLKDDVLDYLDGSILVQGNINSADPASSWIVQIGLSDEMSFFESYEQFNEKLAALVEAEGSSAMGSEEVDGVALYTLENKQDFFWMPEPAWCLHGGRLCIALDMPTLKHWMTSSEPRMNDDVAIQCAISDAEGFGLRNPLGVTRIDVGNVIRLLMSLSSMIGPAMGDFPIDVLDVPPVDVLVNGVEPSVALTFRSDDGFEILGRQTIPGAAPGASLAAIGALGMPAMLQVRAAASRMESTKNMRQIMIAFHNYHDAFMAFPARFNQDKNKKPLLSWRVHILPYLEEQILYDQFHLDEPWDSPHNIKLVEQMPYVYRHPKLKLEAGKTVYLVPVGEDTVGQPPKNDKSTPTGRSLVDVSNNDGTSRTAALLEVSADQAVIWTQPADFEIDDAGFAEKLKAIWKAGLNVAMADASVQTFKADLSEQQWHDSFGMSDGAVQEFDAMQGNR